MKSLSNAVLILGLVLVCSILGFLLGCLFVFSVCLETDLVPKEPAGGQLSPGVYTAFFAGLGSGVALLLLVTVCLACRSYLGRTQGEIEELSRRVDQLQRLFVDMHTRAHKKAAEARQAAGGRPMTLWPAATEEPDPEQWLSNYLELVSED